MSKFNNTHKFTAAAAFGAAAMFSMLSFGSNAEAARNPMSCHGSTAKAVMECCVEITNINHPFEKNKTGRSCQSTFAVACKKYNTFAAANLDCYLRPRSTIFLVLDESNGHGTSVDGGKSRSLQ